MSPPETEFQRLLSADIKAERRLFWAEIVILALTLSVVIWRLFG